MAEPNELKRLCVVLVSTRNPLNIGAAARAMSNFGFSALRLVNPYEPSFREAKSAVGAAKLLADAGVYENLADAVADCTLVVGTSAAQNRELQQPLRLLPDGARRIRKRLASSRVALLFGSEKRGLSNQDLSHCHWLLHIPTQEKHLSMNLGQAVAICLYELARMSDWKPLTEKIQPASADANNRITNSLLEVLRTTGYLKSQESLTDEEKIRRFTLRQDLSELDAELWLGMLRQILWKVKK